MSKRTHTKKNVLIHLCDRDQGRILSLPQTVILFSQFFFFFYTWFLNQYTIRLVFPRTSPGLLVNYIYSRIYGLGYEDNFWGLPFIWAAFFRVVVVAYIYLFAMSPPTPHQIIARLDEPTSYAAPIKKSNLFCNAATEVLYSSV